MVPDVSRAGRAAANLSALCHLTGDNGSLTLPLAPLHVDLPATATDPDVAFTLTDGHLPQASTLRVHVRLHVPDADDETVTFTVRRGVPRQPLRHARRLARIANILERADTGLDGHPDVTGWLTALRTREQLRDAVAVLANGPGLAHLVRHTVPDTPAAVLLQDWSGTLDDLAATVDRLGR